MRFKPKKNIKQRGSKTHGWGSMKKHRGAGNRGGRGNAGSGKRGDCKKSKMTHRNPKYFGKYGFKSKNSPEIKSCNMFYIEKSCETLLKEGKIKENNGLIIINLKELGFDKLLSKGNISRKYKITVKYATPNVIEKIKKKGGEVIISAGKETTKKPKEKIEKTKKEEPKVKEE